MKRGPGPARSHTCAKHASLYTKKRRDPVRSRVVAAGPTRPPTCHKYCANVASNRHDTAWVGSGRRPDCQERAHNSRDGRERSSGKRRPSARRPLDGSSAVVYSCVRRHVGIITGVTSGHGPSVWHHRRSTLVTAIKPENKGCRRGQMLCQEMARARRVTEQILL